MALDQRPTKKPVLSSGPAPEEDDWETDPEPSPAIEQKADVSSVAKLREQVLNEDKKAKEASYTGQQTTASKQSYQKPNERAGTTLQASGKRDNTYYKNYTTNVKTT